MVNMATAPPRDEILKLYPEAIPSEDIKLAEPKTFRFSELAKVRKFFEKEVDNNLVLYKRYKKLLKTIVSIRYLFLFTSLLLNAAGIGALNKILHHNLAIYFESTSFRLDLVAIVISVMEYKIIDKLQKHNEIHTLAAGFLSRLLRNISQAIEDGDISSQELSTVIADQDKYIEMRKEVRKQDFHQSDSQDIIAKFREKINKK